MKKGGRQNRNKGKNGTTRTRLFDHRAPCRLWTPPSASSLFCSPPSLRRLETPSGTCNRRKCRVSTRSPLSQGRAQNRTQSRTLRTVSRARARARCHSCWRVRGVAVVVRESTGVRRRVWVVWLGRVCGLGLMRAVAMANLAIPLPLARHTCPLIHLLLRPHHLRRAPSYEPEPRAHSGTHGWDGGGHRGGGGRGGDSCVDVGGFGAGWDGEEAW